MNSPLQPTLESELLILRPLAVDDFESLYKVASDPLIWEQHPNPDRYKAEVFKDFFAEALASLGAFVVIDRKTNEIIGSSRFYEANFERNEVVIGYTFLERKYWGGKYNRILKTMMLEHALKFFDSVLFHVGVNNLRSQKAMEKIGGIRIGQFEKKNQDGTPRVAFIYQMKSLPRACEA